MRRILVLLVLGFVTTLQAAPPSTSIADFIAIELPISGAPGLAYAVVEDGEIHADARGEVLIGSGRAVGPDTPFLLGSITKSFTAVAVMQLVEAGTVELDTGISHYLELFSGRPSGAITIRQLLSHTSGYSTQQGNDRHTDVTRNADELLRQVERIAQWTPTYEPGTQWEYSNANYLLLGALIETVSGQDYATYIETKILEPVGMVHSFVADGEIHESMATGHRPWFGTKRPMEDTSTQRVTAPAGGVIASASDVARYLAVMMNGEDDIISAESKVEMLRPASAASSFYGLGWFVDSENNTVSHTGSSPGVETLATMLPAEQKAVVILVNAGSGVGFGETTELRFGIGARALGLDYAGGGDRWPQKALFIGMVLLPIGFLVSMIWAWFHRTQLVAKTKSGPFGLFSLWFPLLVTVAVGCVFFFFSAPLFGASLATLRLFAPDLALTMEATGVAGVTWALFRLGLAYGSGVKFRQGHSGLQS